MPVRRILARRCAGVLAWPNSRSNTMRGCGSIGSGVVGDFQEIVFEKKQSSESQPIWVGTFEAQLERRQPRVLAERARGDLIDGRRQPDTVGAAPVAVLCMHAGQPHRGSAGMVAVAVAEVVCLWCESAQHRDVISHRSQRAQNRRQLEVFPRRVGTHIGWMVPFGM